MGSTDGEIIDFDDLATPREPRHWVVAPTAEEDHNWCTWLAIGHHDERMVTDRSARVELEGTIYSGYSMVDALSKAWYATLDPDDFDYLEDEHYEDFAEFLREWGYTVHLAKLKWAQGVLG